MAHRGFARMDSYVGTYRGEEGPMQVITAEDCNEPGRRPSALPGLPQVVRYRKPQTPNVQQPTDEGEGLLEDPDDTVSEDSPLPPTPEPARRRYDDYTSGHDYPGDMAFSD